MVTYIPNPQGGFTKITKPGQNQSVATTGNLLRDAIIRRTVRAVDPSKQSIARISGGSDYGGGLGEGAQSVNGGLPPGQYRLETGEIIDVNNPKANDLSRYADLYSKEELEAKAAALNASGASLKTQFDQLNSSSGADAARINKMYSDVSAENQQIVSDYQSGKIDYATATSMFNALSSKIAAADAAKNDFLTSQAVNVKKLQGQQSALQSEYGKLKNKATFYNLAKTDLNEKNKATAAAKLIKEQRKLTNPFLSSYDGKGAYEITERNVVASTKGAKEFFLNIPILSDFTGFLGGGMGVAKSILEVPVVGVSRVLFPETKGEVALVRVEPSQANIERAQKRAIASAAMSPGSLLFSFLGLNPTFNQAKKLARAKELGITEPIPLGTTEEAAYTAGFVGEQLFFLSLGAVGDFGVNKIVNVIKPTKVIRSTLDIGSPLDRVQQVEFGVVEPYLFEKTVKSPSFFSSWTSAGKKTAGVVESVGSVEAKVFDLSGGVRGSARLTVETNKGVLVKDFPFSYTTDALEFPKGVKPPFLVAESGLETAIRGQGASRVEIARFGKNDFIKNISKAREIGKPSVRKSNLVGDIVDLEINGMNVSSTEFIPTEARWAKLDVGSVQYGKTKNFMRGTAKVKGTFTESKAYLADSAELQAQLTDFFGKYFVGGKVPSTRVNVFLESRRTILTNPKVGVSPVEEIFVLPKQIEINPASIEAQLAGKAGSPPQLLGGVSSSFNEVNLGGGTRGVIVSGEQQAGNVASNVVNQLNLGQEINRLVEGSQSRGPNVFVLDNVGLRPVRTIESERTNNLGLLSVNVLQDSKQVVEPRVFVLGGVSLIDAILPRPREKVDTGILQIFSLEEAILEKEKIQPITITDEILSPPEPGRPIISTVSLPPFPFEPGLGKGGFPFPGGGLNLDFGSNRGRRKFKDVYRNELEAALRVFGRGLRF